MLRWAGGGVGRRPGYKACSPEELPQAKQTRTNNQHLANMALGADCYRLACVCALVALCGARAAPAQLCAGAGDDDPRAARFCQALNTFLELYAEAAGEQVPEYQALVRDYPQLLDSGMKRQDVVHSFLRFGRRR